MPELEVNARYAMEKKLRRQFDPDYSWIKPDPTEEEYNIISNRQRHRNYSY